MLVRAADKLLKIGEGEQGDEAHGIGTHHAESGELVLLVVVVGHHAKQRAERHIDERIDQHHQYIEEVSVDALAHRTKIRRIEQQGEDDAQGDGTKDDPRTVGAPAALRAVSNDADDRVDEDINETRHQHQHGSIVEGQAEDIGEE